MKKRTLMVAGLVLAMSLQMVACGNKTPMENTQSGVVNITGGETSTQNTQTEDTQDAPDTETEVVEIPVFPEILADDPTITTKEGLAIVENSAYEILTYSDGQGETYAEAINSAAESFDGIAKVYNIIIPLSSEVTFPDNARENLSSADQKAALDDILGNMSSKVIEVPIYNALMSHRDEYIYFRTDHHWTQLGAYYSYAEYAKYAGFEPEALSDYELVEYEGFLGSFYSDTKSAALKETPDVLQAYMPKSSSTMKVTEDDGDQYSWPVINDVSKYKAGVKYSAFIAGDNPYTVITNNDLSDGSACIVVKESFGNAFVPFLVDHYQTIYVIDYRYWNGSLVDLAKDNNVKDVIFINNISMVRNTYLIGKLRGIVE